LGNRLGEKVDQRFDLEKIPLPFQESTYDCVLCLDVLEHLENIHQVFDECCRVSRQYVIVALPNPWANFYDFLCLDSKDMDKLFKFYGLPLEPPEDRHKWFFSNEDAEKFIVYRAGQNNMKVLQLDNQRVDNDGIGIRRLIRGIAKAILFRNNLNYKNLHARTLWAVLEKSKDTE